jgi:hypothetical protein
MFPDDRKIGRLPSVSGLTRRFTRTSGSRLPLWRSADRNGRDFAVEPILLVGERRPSVGHARIALMGGLSLGSLGKLKTIVGVIPEDVRLFHVEDVGTELSRRNPLTGS